MTTTTLYFVRHGETLWNAEKRMQGHLNSDLTTTGKEQARLLGKALAATPINACYTSDSQRALETADLVTRQLDLTPQASPALREIAMGNWEGRTRLDIQKTDPLEWQHFWEAPHEFQGLNGGETFEALEKRSMTYLNQLLTKHSGENILLVSHRLTIKTIINHLLSQEIADLHQLADVEPNSFSHLEITQEQVRLINYSDTSHYAHM